MRRRTWLALCSPSFPLPGQPVPSLRLIHPADRDAFRRWFAALAEWAFLVVEEHRPREISDCSALLRFCFRESLKQHNASWAAELGIDEFPALPDVRQFHYPRTPVGANLFRTASGDYRQFADAENLMRFNTVRIGQDLEPAQPGDLLFYRQLTPTEPFHSMIWIGKSAFEASNVRYVAYHTGPVGSHTGELRRPAVEDLLNHKNPRWRPVAGNANFLGLYRWTMIT